MGQDESERALSCDCRSARGYFEGCGVIRTSNGVAGDRLCVTESLDLPVLYANGRALGIVGDMLAFRAMQALMRVPVGSDVAPRSFIVVIAYDGKLLGEKIAEALVCGDGDGVGSGIVCVVSRLEEAVELCGAPDSFEGGSVAVVSDVHRDPSDVSNVLREVHSRGGRVVSLCGYFQYEGFGGPTVRCGPEISSWSRELPLRSSDEVTANTVRSCASVGYGRARAADRVETAVGRAHASEASSDQVHKLIRLRRVREVFDLELSQCMARMLQIVYRCKQGAMSEQEAVELPVLEREVHVLRSRVGECSASIASLRRLACG